MTDTADTWHYILVLGDAWGELDHTESYRLTPEQYERMDPNLPADTEPNRAILDEAAEYNGQPVIHVE